MYKIPRIYRNFPIKRYVFSDHVLQACGQGISGPFLLLKRLMHQYGRAQQAVGGAPEPPFLPPVHPARTGPLAFPKRHKSPILFLP